MGKLLHKLVNGIVPSWFTKVKTSDNSPKKLLPFIRGGVHGSGRKSFPVSYPSNTELMGLLAEDHESSYGSDEDTELGTKFSTNSYTAPNSSPTSVISASANTSSHNESSVLTTNTTKDQFSPGHHRRKLSSHIIDEEKQQQEDDRHEDLQQKRRNKKQRHKGGEKKHLQENNHGDLQNSESIHDNASDSKKWNQLYRKLHLKHHGKRVKEESVSLMDQQHHQNYSQEHDADNSSSQYHEQHQKTSEYNYQQHQKKKLHQNLGHHLQHEQRLRDQQDQVLLHQHHDEEHKKQQRQQQNQVLHQHNDGKQQRQQQKEEDEEEDRLSETHSDLRRSKRKSSSDLMEENSASQNHGRKGSVSISLSLKRRKLVVATSELPDRICSIVGNGSALVKYSEDPYLEFWESMVEMIVGNGLWDMGNLEFLLYCYLSLNEPHLHETIHKSFIQVLKDLQRTSPFQMGANS